MNENPKLYKILLENNKDKSPMCFFRDTTGKHIHQKSFKKF